MLAAVLKLFSHAFALILALCISVVALGVIVVALWGTGAFTTSPPPEEPGYLAAVVTGGLWIGTEALLYLGWRRLIRALNAFEAEQS